MKKGIFLGGVLVAFSAVVFSSVNYYRNTQKQAFEILCREGELLLEALMRSSSNTIRAEETLEELIASDLLATARLIDLIRFTRVSSLREVAYLNHLERIDVVDGKGKVVLSTQTPRKLPFSQDSIADVLKGEREAKAFEWKGNYVVALKRKGKPGAVLVYKSIESVKELEREIGIGEMIKNVAMLPGVVYLVLQSEDGIITATPNVREISKVESDSFLLKVIQSRAISFRKYLFNGEEVLEAAEPFVFENRTIGIFRLGLSMDEYSQILSQARRQILLLMLGFVIALALGLALVAAVKSARRAERSLTRMEEMEKEVYESFPLGIVKITKDDTIAVVNERACEILGRTRKQLEGREYSSLYPNDLLKVKDARETANYKKAIVTLKEDDVSKSIAVSASPIGENILVILEDLTEKLEIEEKLRLSKQFETFTELARGIAHEIRNPLNTVMIASQRLEKEFSSSLDDPEFSELIKTLRDEAFRLEANVRKLLDLIKPLRMNMRPDNLSELVEEVVRTMKAETAEKNIEISVFVEKIEDFPFDREAMRQVLINLLRNSIDALPNGGRIEVSLEETDGKVVLRVRDTGIGIEKECLDKIFLPHFTTKKDGMGLGLSLVKRVVEAHGGTIRVESIRGLGTTFIIELPRHGHSSYS